jgi:hypothetical protein
MKIVRFICKIPMESVLIHLVVSGERIGDANARSGQFWRRLTSDNKHSRLQSASSSPV